MFGRQEMTAYWKSPESLFYPHYLTQPESPGPVSREQLLPSSRLFVTSTSNMSKRGKMKLHFTTVTNTGYKKYSSFEVQMLYHRHCFLVNLREGSKNKKKKKYGIFHTFFTPPPRQGKVWNLFMIFFQHARVKFALFFDMICYIWAQGKMGIVAFKLNMFQRIFQP